MSQKIPIEILSSLNNSYASSKNVLLGEIDGVETVYHVLPIDSEKSIKIMENCVHILFFISGTGVIAAAYRIVSITDQTLYIPSVDNDVRIKSKSNMEFLEIIWNLTESEYHSIKVNSLPYVLKYSEAKTYKEAIKSPKTVNRTLVHEDLIPRFCMGSVETDGPDAVGAHKHPMLEQHFFGLPGNYCYVKADDAEVTFHERALLHIPLGSEHSVRVDAGHKLHYIWIDYFRDAAGVEWIKKMHKSDK